MNGKLSLRMLLSKPLSGVVDKVLKEFFKNLKHKNKYHWNNKFIKHESSFWSCASLKALSLEGEKQPEMSITKASRMGLKSCLAFAAWSLSFYQKKNKANSGPKVLVLKPAKQSSQWKYKLQYLLKETP